MLSIAIDNALTVCTRCIVVTGAHRAAAQSALPASVQVEEVYNQDHEAGMLGSIAAGAERVRTEWFFVAPGDMPRLAPAVFAALMEVALRYDHDEGQAPAALFPVYQGRRGHPVLISRRVIPELLQRVAEYRSMRDFLRGSHTVDIAIPDAGILLDIDTPGELESAEDTGGERNV